MRHAQRQESTHVYRVKFEDCKGTEFLLLFRCPLLRLNDTVVFLVVYRHELLQTSSLTTMMIEETPRCVYLTKMRSIISVVNSSERNFVVSDRN